MEAHVTEVVETVEAVETDITWETPTFEEISVSAEINSYVNADL